MLMARLSDGRKVPLHTCCFVLRDTCGCPRGVVHAATGNPEQVICVDDAWRALLPNAQDRARARQAGMQVELMPQERWLQEIALLLQNYCPHTSRKGAADA